MQRGRDLIGTGWNPLEQCNALSTPSVHVAHHVWQVAAHQGSQLARIVQPCMHSRACMQPAPAAMCVMVEVPEHAPDTVLISRFQAWISRVLLTVARAAWHVAPRHLSSSKLWLVVLVVVLQLPCPARHSLSERAAPARRLRRHCSVTCDTIRAPQQLQRPDSSVSASKTTVHGRP
jgi:hypothetical protein